MAVLSLALMVPMPALALFGSHTPRQSRPTSARILARPDAAELAQQLAQASPNARMHAGLREIVSTVKSALGPRLTLNAGPGAGVAIGIRF